MTRRAPRVLVTTDAVGGVWTYSLALARGLIERGVEVTLARLGPPAAPAQRREAAAIEGLRIEAIEGPLDWTATDEAALERVATALAALARRAGADVVHLNTPSLAALADFAPPVIGVCHSCETTWGAAVAAGEATFEPAWRPELRARGYAACHQLVAPSRSFADATATAYGLDVRVVHNGGDASGRVRRPVERLVLAVGRFWDPAKDMATLDRAAAELGTPVVALGALTHPCGGVVQPAHARAMGQLSHGEVADWMARAAVFASCARYEPFGLAVLEAAHAGCALVLSDISSFRELWEGAATFVAVGDAHGFAREFRRLLDDPQARARAAEAAAVRARRYSIAAQTDAMMALYAELAPAAFAPSSVEAAA